MEISELVGKVFNAVGAYNNEVRFLGDESFKLYHRQKCCERVCIEVICGDLDDLAGAPILAAACVVRGENHGDDGYESWAFYYLSTQKGIVSIRFYGTARVYAPTYGDFCRIEARPK